MRISVNANVDVATTAKTKTITQNVDKLAKQGSEASYTTAQNSASVEKSIAAPLDNSEETKQKVQEAVHTMNEILEANHNASKFVYHEGLDRYYVSVVNRDTDEVVKEIPPKKLLDAFYEMQKMVGMIVDEKI
ncbi:flagellar protein FlaG [Solibacillus silvestris]|uniref:flagellar protein FlaG n=1 Tax=Solibacillus silvestris TaxID=76853 RepID=UPI003F7E1637